MKGSVRDQTGRDERGNEHRCLRKKRQRAEGEVNRDRTFCLRAPVDSGGQRATSAAGHSSLSPSSS